MNHHRTIRSIPAASLAVVALLAGCGDGTESTLPAVQAAGADVVTSFQVLQGTGFRGVGQNVGISEAVGADVVTSDRHYNETARFQSLKPDVVTWDRHHNESARFQSLKPDVATWDRHHNETARFQSLEPSNVPEHGTAQRLIAEAIDAQLYSRQNTASRASTVDTAQRLIAESIEAELEARRGQSPTPVKPFAPLGPVLRPV